MCHARLIVRNVQLSVAINVSQAILVIYKMIDYAVNAKIIARDVAQQINVQSVLMDLLSYKDSLVHAHH